MIDGNRADMDALNSYWDEVVAGTAARPDELDDRLATAVRQLHAMGATPAVDAAFAERLWHELMQSAPPIARPVWRRRALGQPRRVVAPLAVAAALLVALLTALVGVYPWGASPTPVDAQEIVRKSIMAASMRGAVHSFALTERVTRQPGNSALPLLAGYKGVVESVVTRWYEAPNRWRIERRYVIPPRGTLAREYDTPSVQVNDGKIVQNYDEQSRTVQLQYPPFPSGTADLFPLGQGDASPAPGQTPHGLSDILHEATTCYTPTVTGSGSIAGQAAYIVNLERKGCYSASAHEIDGRLTLWIDKNTFFVLRSILYDVGDRTRPYVTTEVTRVRYNPSLDQRLFTFTPPLGATVQGAPATDATNARAAALARTVDFPLFVPGEALAGLRLRTPRFDARGTAYLTYAPPSGAVDTRRSVTLVERKAAASDAIAKPSGAAPVLVGGGPDAVSGWYRQSGADVRSVEFVRNGAYITLSSALLPKDNLVELAGSLLPVAGGKPLHPNPQVRGLTALRAHVPFPIFVPTYVPRGLTPQEPSLGAAGSLITIDYDAPDGTAALSVGNGAAGCCID